MQQKNLSRYKGHALEYVGAVSICAFLLLVFDPLSKPELWRKCLGMFLVIVLGMLFYLMARTVIEHIAKHGWRG
jgi:hypothetical protein